jgi:hypothetical protein
VLGVAKELARLHNLTMEEIGSRLIQNFEKFLSEARSQA